MPTVRALALPAVALSLAAGVAQADGGKTIVVAAESRGDATAAAVLAAAARGATRAEPAAVVADASLADSAFILGCDPGVPRCRADVAEQLGYERMVIVSHTGTAVEVVVWKRGGASPPKTYVVAAAGDPALATIEADVAGLMGAPPAATSDPVVGGLGADGAVAVDAPTGPRPVPRAALIVGGGGGALVLAGVALWGLAASTQGEIDDAPTATVADLERLADLEADADRYASAGNGLVIGGGVAVVAAGVWILWHRRHERARVRVTPVVAPGSATVTLEASW